MRTVPATITDHARDGSEFIWLVDVFPSLPAELSAIDPAQLIFSEQFDDASVLADLFVDERWANSQQEVGGVCTISTEQAYTGTKSLKCVAPAGAKADIVRFWLDLRQSREVFFSFRVYLSSWSPTAGDTLMLFDIEAPETGTDRGSCITGPVQFNSPGRQVYLSSSFGLKSILNKWCYSDLFGQIEGTAFPTGQWVKLDVWLYLSANADGRMRVWRNGTLTIDGTGRTLAREDSIDNRLQIGITKNNSATASATAYFDDINIWQVPSINWADRAVTVGGKPYTGGLIKAIDPIKYSAKIVQGGAVATRDAVSIHLLDRDKSLQRLIQEQNVDGRDVQVSLALMPLNLVRNSSFETPTMGDNFEYWTETAGHASNTITRQTSGPSEGAQYVRLVNAGSPGPTIQSDPFSIRRGTTVSLSFDAKAASGGQLLRAKILWNGLYWNDSTRVWQVGTTHVTFTLTTSWARYTLNNVYSATEPFTNVDAANMTVLFELNATGTVDIDAVQLEARLRASSYHRGRHDVKAVELFPVYWGEIRAPKWKTGVVTLATKSIMNRRHRDVPVTIISNSIDAAWQIPPDNVGKPFPMTFGDFLIDNLPFGKIFPSVGAAAQGVLVNSVKSTGANIRVYFDKPGIALGVHSAIYHFGTDARRYFREFLNTDSSNYSEWTYSSSDSYIESKAEARFLRQGLMRLSALLLAVDVNPDLGNYADFTNPLNLSDDDINSYSSITLTSALTKDLYFRPQKPQELAGLKVIKAYPLYKVENILNSGTASREIRWYAVNLVSPELLTSGSGVAANIPNGVPQDTNEQAHELSLTNGPDTSNWLGGEQDYLLRCTLISGSSPSVTFRLYGAGLRLDVGIDLTDAIICRSILGRPYGDTWGGRKTSSSVIYGAVNIIEAIIRHELGMATAEINTGTFDQANTDISGRGDAAGQVFEITPSIKVIEQLCACHGTVYYTDGAGKEAIRVLKHGTAAKKLRPRDFGLDKIEPEYIEREEIITDFTLRWGYVHGAETYVGHTFCNRNDSNIGDAAYETKCANAYAALGNRENPRIYESKWINDEASAQGVLKFLINWCGSRRRIVKGRVAFLDQLDLEFGDRVDLQLEDYLLERDTDSTRPIFTPYEYTIRKAGSEARVDISFLEVIAP